MSLPHQYLTVVVRIPNVEACRPVFQRLDEVCQEITGVKIAAASWSHVMDQRNRYREAIEKTLKANLHLADGENCTLIDLKRALRES